MKPRPNIIIILADDYGYGDVGCYGSERFQTPNLDALAAGGIRFTDFHSNAGTCSPTRAALMTGRYQQRCGIQGVITAAGHRHTGLDLTETTIAEVLKPAGYSTAIFGKWHLGYKAEYSPIHQGFDEFVGFVSGNVDYHAHLDQTGVEDWWKQDQLLPEVGYTTDLITDHAVDFIQRNREQPFFLYIAHEAPHYPIQGRNDPPQYEPGKGRVKVESSFETYREMIEVMDENIGRVKKAVDDAGLTKNTFIFFFSDNGPATHGSAGPLRGKKGQIWEGGHRVPAIAYWPGKIAAGQTSSETAMGADLLPTLAAMSGTPLPDGIQLDGVDLSSHLLTESSLASRNLYWSFGNQMAVRQKQFKLVTNRKFENPRLYNLAEDIGEKVNIADENPELVKALLAALREWHGEVNAGTKRRS